MDEQRLLLREATSPWCIGPRKPIRRQLLRKLVRVESIAAPIWTTQWGPINPAQ